MYVPFGFLARVLIGVLGVAVVFEEMVDDEAAGNELAAGELAREGLFEKRNGCWVSSRRSRVSDRILAKALDVKKRAHHQHYRCCPEAWILDQRSRLD